MTTLADVRHLWSPAGPYLDTATYGLPPRPVLEAVEAAMAGWRTGAAHYDDWTEATEAARATFARLVAVPLERVAVGATVSELVGLLAAGLPDGTRVVAPDVEFTSLLFPFLVHAQRDVEVATVPVARLAEAIGPGTGVVATSLVQSATGEVADLEAVVAAARAHGALVVVDATQACGWLPCDASAVDALVCGAYKWLMSPRGTAFLTVSDDLLPTVRPLAAGWFAGEDVHGAYYGPPLRLAATARRLDTSPAWFSWVGTRPALELVEQIGVEAIHAHDVALANRFRAGLGLPPGDSAIVSAGIEGAAERLERAGVRAAVRDGRLRASFHLYTTEADVDAALAALG